MKAVEPFSVTVFANSLDEITLDVVIDKVRKAAVIDDGAESAKENPYSVEQFQAALKEEVAANATFFGDKVSAIRRTDGLMLHAHFIRSSSCASHARMPSLIMFLR